jgi:hypothetical protein
MKGYLKKNRKEIQSARARAHTHTHTHTNTEMPVITKQMVCVCVRVCWCVRVSVSRLCVSMCEPMTRFLLARFLFAKVRFLLAFPNARRPGDTLVRAVSMACVCVCMCACVSKHTLLHYCGELNRKNRLN